jgi:hypothetical protein
MLGDRDLLRESRMALPQDSPGSPGARTYYDQLRARGKTHHQALRQLANRWVGILHVCLQRGQPYDEPAAWQHLETIAA